MFVIVLALFSIFVSLAVTLLLMLATSVSVAYLISNAADGKNMIDVSLTSNTVVPFTNSMTKYVGFVDRLK
ncbi:peptide ABC superfamily ATP binding cassette transporter [Prevotella dentalis DSM 3688]|uniref:Peptide ABC superfamily ATP binding cassette transporter n=1 Tax=Prevotella dentalis (strain ATCC 49559 / DSM 3688 / JCM 13448 / NCTC 12043 / ES 2772) TaxID=908937 RepID=F9D2Y6_PREDD|nr:peptide ABC superfamily ATP binding cassette transporter [Prevotella dentalis DSM 3688]